MNAVDVETRALELLTEIAEEIPRFRGNLWAFVHSIDWIDRAWPEALRRKACELAWLVAPEADELAERAHVALCWACCGDDYAEREIAGRFRRAVQRARLIDAISRHPSRRDFSTLVRALERGKFTPKQWALAQRLAKEAPRAEAR